MDVLDLETFMAEYTELHSSPPANGNLTNNTNGSAGTHATSKNVPRIRKKIDAGEREVPVSVTTLGQMKRSVAKAVEDVKHSLERLDSDYKELRKIEAYLDSKIASIDQNAHIAHDLCAGCSHAQSHGKCFTVDGASDEYGSPHPPSVYSTTGHGFIYGTDAATLLPNLPPDLPFLGSSPPKVQEKIIEFEERLKKEELKRSASVASSLRAKFATMPALRRHKTIHGSLNGSDIKPNIQASPAGPDSEEVPPKRRPVLAANYTNSVLDSTIFKVEPSPEPEIRPLSVVQRKMNKQAGSTFHTPPTSPPETISRTNGRSILRPHAHAGEEPEPEPEIAPLRRKPAAQEELLMPIAPVPSPAPSFKANNFLHATPPIATASPIQRIRTNKNFEIRRATSMAFRNYFSGKTTETEKTDIPVRSSSTVQPGVSRTRSGKKYGHNLGRSNLNHSTLSLAENYSNGSRGSSVNGDAQGTLKKSAAGKVLAASRKVSVMLRQQAAEEKLKMRHAAIVEEKEKEKEREAKVKGYGGKISNMKARFEGGMLRRGLSLRD